MLSFKRFLTFCEADLPFFHLFEGGNVWKGNLATQRINKADVVPTVKWLEQIVGFPLADNIAGSGGKKPSSGDIDVVVDQAKHNKDQVAAALTAWAAKNDRNALVKKSGMNIHFRTPIKGNPQNGYVQTDLMFMPDVQFAKWSMSYHEGSQYRGFDRMILIKSIAISLGLKWSWLHGLVVRGTETPLRGGKDPEYVAKVLLGPDGTADDLRSVETIMAKLANDPDREAKLADAKATLGKEGVEIK